MNEIMAYKKNLIISGLKKLYESKNNISIDDLIKNIKMDINKDNDTEGYIYVIHTDNMIIHDYKFYVINITTNIDTIKRTYDNIYNGQYELVLLSNKIKNIHLGNMIIMNELSKFIIHNTFVFCDLQIIEDRLKIMEDIINNNTPKSIIKNYILNDDNIANNLMIKINRAIKCINMSKNQNPQKHDELNKKIMNIFDTYNEHPVFVNNSDDDSEEEITNNNCHDDNMYNNIESAAMNQIENNSESSNNPICCSSGGTIMANLFDENDYGETGTYYSLKKNNDYSTMNDDKINDQIYKHLTTELDRY